MYQEEIRVIKAAKVKLVKQMKEEADKVRQWKQTKEKEVIQLKQADRKKAAAMSKMSVQHERKQNVLKRRMEEVLAINKRLKEAQAKKASARATKASAGVGLTGAGERVRGWVKTEMDVVVSAQEAEQARQQLIKERKTLAEEIQKLKVECRRTMTHQEMEETSTKQTDLQEQLDMRNLQISELQEDHDASGDGGNLNEADRPPGAIGHEESPDFRAAEGDYVGRARQGEVRRPLGQDDLHDRLQDCSLLSVQLGHRGDGYGYNKGS